MPILINHPAHIHGLWAITPDRSRLSSSGQSPGYEDEATRWNKFMFQTCASWSWAKLLLHRSSTSWKEERFGLWPLATSSPVDLWGRLDDWVIDLIISEELPVWNAKDKCVDLESAHIFQTARNHKYVLAIASVMPSAVFLDDAMLDKVIRRSAGLQKPKQVATPSTVKLFLREGVPVIQAQVAPLLLEYCLLDALTSQLRGESRRILYDGFKGIPFWPNIAGGFSAAGQLFLPRDAEETKLFSKARPTVTLDIERITPPLLNLFRIDIVHMSAIMRLRRISDLNIDWPLVYPVSPKSTSLVGRNKSHDTTLENLWNWIMIRHKQDDEPFPSTLYELWMLPITNSRIRQLAPRDNSPLMLVASKSNPQYRLMVNIAGNAQANAPPILDVDALPAAALKFLRTQMMEVHRFQGASFNDCGSFVSWLAASGDIISTANEKQKTDLLQILESLANSSSPSVYKDRIVRENLKDLPLFHRVQCSAPFE